MTLSNFQAKYGKYAVLFGGADGLGAETAKKLAEKGLSIVCVDYSQEKLDQFEAEFRKIYSVDFIPVKIDLSEENAVLDVFDVTDRLDVGFVSYIAALHKFGKIQDISWDDYMKMFNVNILNFTKAMKHYMGIFVKQGHGGIMNYSSLTALTSSPYNVEYGAGKAYIKSFTQAMAYEGEKEGVDVMVATLGATATPTELKAQPQGDLGAKIQSMALTPEDTVNEIFDNFGKIHSYYVGEHPKSQVKKWRIENDDDGLAEYMGKFYE